MVKPSKEKRSTPCLSLPTTEEVKNRLAACLPGANLYDHAQERGIWIQKEGKKNKGWVGQTLEALSGLPTSSLAGRDGADFELKSTTVFQDQDGGWRFQETLKINQLNVEHILFESFSQSLLYQKLSRMLLVGVYHRDKESCFAQALYDIQLGSHPLMLAIETFWTDVKWIVAQGDFGLLDDLGKSSDLIQLRPVGKGGGWHKSKYHQKSYSHRAFYLTKKCMNQITQIQSGCEVLYFLH